MGRGVCTVMYLARKCKSGATNVNPIFAINAIGVMNIKPITKYKCAIDAMPFIVRLAMKWIGVGIVGKSCVVPARPC